MNLHTEGKRGEAETTAGGTGGCTLHVWEKSGSRVSQQALTEAFVSGVATTTAVVQIFSRWTGVGRGLCASCVTGQHTSGGSLHAVQVCWRNRLWTRGVVWERCSSPEQAPLSSNCPVGQPQLDKRFCSSVFGAATLPGVNSGVMHVEPSNTAEATWRV